MNTPLFYHTKPVFAVDVGQSTVKVVQLKNQNGKARLVGYGYADFDSTAISKGEIIKPELLIKSLRPLLKQIVIGKLTTDRVVASIPTAYIFTRILSLPQMESEDLTNAVALEAQQYVPLPSDEIYIEHAVLEKTDKEDKITVLMVATPKKIVTSYMKLFAELDLEVYGLEPSLFAIMRAVNHTKPGDTPKVVIDFGSKSSDLTIYDGTIRLTSTITTGGDHITQKIADALDIDLEKAAEIKTRYGISKSKWQEKLAPALQPVLASLTAEVQKMLRYHHDRNDTKEAITDIVIVGGGANLPGLSDFLAHLTGINVSTCNPWENIIIKPLQPPHQLETTLYTTAVGLALKELEKA